MTRATSWRPTYLVLDSTEICRDWLLRGLAFRAMRHIRARTGMSIVVPAPVLAEVHANHSRATSGAERALKRAARTFQQLGVASIKEPDDFTGTEQSYPEKLARAMELLDIETLPWPRPEHEQIVWRAVERRPPFDTSGGGYRDTLVWLSALALAEEGARVVLASRDKAFAGTDGMLHPSLAAEGGTARGGTIELTRNLDHWVVQEIPWSEGVPLTELAGDARDDVFFQFLMQWGFEDLQIDDLDLGLPASTGAVELDDVRSESEVDRSEVRRMDDGGTYVQYRVRLELQLVAEMAADDAALCGLLPEHGPDRLGRVSVRPKVKAVAVFGVLYDEYDVGFDVATLELERDGETVTTLENQHDYSQLVLWEDDLGGAGQGGTLGEVTDAANPKSPGSDD